jgi:hypothetical protein
MPWSGHEMREDVESLACALITRHRDRAVLVALGRLNKSIDRRDWRARDFWGQVVHAIHAQQHSGELASSPLRLLPLRGFGG